VKREGASIIALKKNATTLAAITDGVLFLIETKIIMKRFMDEPFFFCFPQYSFCFLF
jgi:hypothetical protein